MRWNGTNVESRVNSGSWQATPAGALNTATGNVQIGRGVVAGTTSYYDGLMGEIICAPTYLADTTFDAIKAYMNTLYGLSL
jgi:hypothetical protein